MIIQSTLVTTYSDHTSTYTTSQIISFISSGYILNDFNLIHIQINIFPPLKIIYIVSGWEKFQPIFGLTTSRVLKLLCQKMHYGQKKLIEPQSGCNYSSMSSVSNNVARIQVPVLINPLRAKFFRGNINIYSHFVSFLRIDMTQVLKILPQAREGPR